MIQKINSALIIDAVTAYGLIKTPFKFYFDTLKESDANHDKVFNESIKFMRLLNTYLDGEGTRYNS